MKKHIVALFLVCVVAQMVFAQIPSTYYASANNKKGEALREALHTCIASHKTLNYDALEQYYIPTDFRPDSTLWDVYSTCEFYYKDAGGTQNDFCQHWNKEHTVCQSWFGSGAMESDLFQVLPTDARVNNLRSNWPYGETASRNDNISRGANALGHLGNSSLDGYTGVGTVYEPDDRYKGDIARIYFYMATCYINKALNGSNGSTMFTFSGGKTGLTDYSVALLMKWHRNDPVSAKEINRNDSVYKQQGNRNPFVDFPELAEYIWGNKTATTLDLENILTAYSKDYVPLDTEGGSDDVDYAKYGVNWFANGEKIGTDSVFKNHKITTLPETPVSCSSHSNTFVGWSGAAIAGTAQTRPSDLFTTAAESPAISANTNLYAVFAHVEQGQGVGAVTATASFTSNDGYKASQVVSSATAGKVTITFNQGGASNPTKYFTTGNAIRCYAHSSFTLTGATITRVEFVHGSTDNTNPITANTGTLKDDVWTGSTNSLTFTIGDDSKFRSFSAIKVTYDDNTTVFTYSDYLTSCDGSSMEVQHVQKQQPAAQKVLIDGKLYILIGEKIFTITGQQIK